MNRQRIKTGFLAVMLAAASGYSLWQKLQWPAVLCLVLLVGLLYKQYTRRFIESCFSLIEGKRLSKLGQLEFQSDKPSLDVKNMTFTEMMLADFTPQDASLLVTVYKSERFHPRNNIVRDRLRKMRDKGWLEHDKPVLGESTEVWLSPAGKAVAEAIFQSAKTDFSVQSPAEPHA